MSYSHEEIKKAVREAIKEDREAFWIESERHYNEHEFLRKIISRLDTVSKASTWGIGIALISLIGSGIWIIIKDIIKRAGGS